VRQWRRFNFKFMLALVSKRVDYMTNSSIAFLFPGQGSQAVGMGGALAASHAAAKQVFEEINDALGENLFAIMQDGPDDAIRMTRNAQPALFATSMAAVRVLEAELGAPLSSRGGMTAGHSLGEYPALSRSPLTMPPGKSSLAVLLPRLMRRLKLPRQPDCGEQSNCPFRHRFIAI
jgi:acyl transferase domain-containing protein